MLKNIFIGLFISTLFLMSACERPGTPSTQRTSPGIQEESLSEIEKQGKRVYHNNCVACHGANGKLKLNGATDLTTSNISFVEAVYIIENGREAMLPFGGILSDDDIRAVTDYIMLFREN